MFELNDIEQKTIDEYDKASELYNAADDALERIFRCRYTPLLKAGKFEEVREIIRVMPDSVARMFAADALRVARGDFDET